MKKHLIILFILLITLQNFPKDDQFGYLDLMYYYNTNNQKEKIAEYANKFDFSKLSVSKKNLIIAKMIDFADSIKDKNPEISKAIYEKILKDAPEHWYVQNKIQKLDNKNSFILIFKKLGKQFLNLTKDFSSFLLLISNFTNSLLYSLLFVFFIFSLIIFKNYFILLVNDVIIGSDGNISIKNSIIIIVLLLWPMLVLSGWSIYPFLVFGVLYGYMSKSEKKAVYIFTGIILSVLLINALNIVLTDNYKTESFKIDRNLFDGTYTNEEFSHLNNKQKTLYALSEYKKNNIDKSFKILNSVDYDYFSVRKSILLGNLYYNKYISSTVKDSDLLTKSMNSYIKVLRKYDNNEIALNNLALILLNGENNEDTKKTFNTYIQRFPRLSYFKDKIIALKAPKSDKNYLWKKIFLLSESSFNPIKLLNAVIISFFSLPFIYYLLIFFIYTKILKKIFINLGRSTTCSKCSKIIDKNNIHKSYKLCDDCHQLFLIKDVIFLEAKLLKEKELKKKNFRNFKKIAFLSILFPGLIFKFRGNNILFLSLSTLLYFLLIFSYSGYLNFVSLNLPLPYIFNISGILAGILYFIINIASITGEDYGF